MTWNLWWRFGPWEQRMSAIQQVIAAEEPDVVCLQEVWSEGDDSSAALLAAEAGYHMAITDDPFGGRQVGFHNAVLSRWPVEVIASAPLPAADGGPGHRRALAVRCATPFGSWPVISTHLDHRFDQSAVRQTQAAALLGLVDEIRGDPDVDLPVIVGGDFNAAHDSDEVRLLTGRRPGPIHNLVLSDCWEHVGGIDGCTWRSDNPYQPNSAWPNRRLDYVFVSWPRPKPVGNPLRAWLAGHEPVDGLYPSDHAAVVVDLVAPALAPSARR